MKGSKRRLFQREYYSEALAALRSPGCSVHRAWRRRQHQESERTGAGCEPQCARTAGVPATEFGLQLPQRKVNHATAKFVFRRTGRDQLQVFDNVPDARTQLVGINYAGKLSTLSLPRRSNCE